MCEEFCLSNSLDSFRLNFGCFVFKAEILLVPQLATRADDLVHPMNFICKE